MESFTMTDANKEPVEDSKTPALSEQQTGQALQELDQLASTQDDSQTSHLSAQEEDSQESPPPNEDAFTTGAVTQSNLLPNSENSGDRQTIGRKNSDFSSDTGSATEVDLGGDLTLEGAQTTRSNSTSLGETTAVSIAYHV